MLKLTRMRALVRHRESTSLEGRESPSPGTYEVIIAIELVGICRTDLRAASGAIPVTEGRILGHEAVGRVVDRGAKSEIELHTRVVLIPWIACRSCATCKAGGELRCEHAKFLGLDVDGAFAEFVRVDARDVIQIPEAFEPWQAAMLEPIAAALAVGPALVHGPTVIVGEGRIAALTQLVLAESRESDIRNIQIVGHGDEVARGRRFESVIECDGSASSLALAVDLCRPGGQLLLKARPYDPIALPVTKVVQRELRLIGCNYAPFQLGLDWLSRHRDTLRPFAGEVFGLGDWQRAFALAQAESKKVFLDPAV